jgi:hypothetical protein
MLAPESTFRSLINGRVAVAARVINNLRLQGAKAMRKTIVSIAAMCLLFVAYIFAVATYQSRIAPAPGVKTYWQLKKQGVQFTRSVSVSTPPDHVILFGEMKLWTLPSGPPAYLFSESGELVDFTSDIGDSTTFQNVYKVHTGAEVDLLTIDEQFSKVAARTSTAKVQP